MCVGGAAGRSQGAQGACRRETTWLPPGAVIQGLLLTGSHWPELTATCAESHTTFHLSLHYSVVESSQISHLLLPSLPSLQFSLFLRVFPTVQFFHCHFRRAWGGDVTDEPFFFLTFIHFLRDRERPSVSGEGVEREGDRI